jgi:hypothetical protein
LLQHKLLLVLVLGLLVLDQHLAYLRQQQTPGDHRPWAAEAALEAHLNQQRITPNPSGAKLLLQQRP